MELPQIESWLRYATVRQLTNTHSIRQGEVPTEYFVSLPLPTLRFALPAYACFAAASSRKVPPVGSTEQLEITQQRPDRWWLFSARSEQLLQYAQCQLTDFTDNPLPEHITFTDSRKLSDVRQLMKTFDQLMENVVVSFFNQSPVDPSLRQDLLTTLNELIIPEQLPVYASLVPDFFAYLSA